MIKFHKPTKEDYKNYLCYFEDKYDMTTDEFLEKRKNGNVDFGPDALMWETIVKERGIKLKGGKQNQFSTE